MNDKYKNTNIYGVEFDNTIYNETKKIKFNNKNNNKINLINENFLTYKPLIKFDLIIGNLPYYVIKKKR